MARHSAPSRRRVLAGAAAAATVIAAPAVVRAQAKAIKLAVLLPRSGYLGRPAELPPRGAIAPKVLADFGYQVDLVHVDIESESGCRPHPVRTGHQ